MIGFKTQAFKPSRIYRTMYAGRYCECSVVHKNDFTGMWGDTIDKPKRRSQYSSQFLYQRGINHSLEFSLCFPSYQDRMTVMDLHSQDGTKSPFYMVANGKKLILVYNGKSAVSTQIVPGQWIDFEIETNLIDFRLFIDGESFLDGNIDAPDTVNFKIGCYEFDNNWENSDIREVYFQL